MLSDACIGKVGQFKLKKMEPNTTYLIKTRAVANEKICRTEENQEFLKKLFNKYISPIAEIKSIQITDEELSAIIKTKTSFEILQFKKNIPLTKNNWNKSSSYFISNQFKRLFNSYAHSYNQYFNRYGRLYASTFKRQILLE
ncbi:MAG: hypothetical protein ACK476_01810 [Fluviicola sp.]